MKSICILVGDISGDMHAASVCEQLLKREPQFKLYGMGGDHMESAGVKILMHVKYISSMGGLEVLKIIPRLRAFKKRLYNIFTDNPPSALVLVDYAGFNLQIAKMAKKFHIPVIYYITPKVWAWNYRRIHKIKKYVNMCLVILNFEEEIFLKESINAMYVGNPTLEAILKWRPDVNFRLKNNLNSHKLIGFFPGSRESEIKAMMPDMIKAANILKEKKLPLQFMFSCARPSNKSLIEKIMENYRASYAIYDGNSHELMAAADLLVLKSGTSTLEAGLIGTPMIVVYKTSYLTYLIGMALIKIPYYSLVNIILKRFSVPELIQHNCTPDNIVKNLEEYLEPDCYDRMIKEFSELKSILGSKKPSILTALHILEACGIRYAS